jgi:hypothetical protein
MVHQGDAVGIRSDLYEKALADWMRHTFDLPNNASGAKVKGRECRPHPHGGRTQAWSERLRI